MPIGGSSVLRPSLGYCWFWESGGEHFPFLPYFFSFPTPWAGLHFPRNILALVPWEVLNMDVVTDKFAVIWLWCSIRRGCSWECIVHCNTTSTTSFPWMQWFAVQIACFCVWFYCLFVFVKLLGWTVYVKPPHLQSESLLFGMHIC